MDIGIVNIKGSFGPDWSSVLLQEENLPQPVMQKLYWSLCCLAVVFVVLLGRQYECTFSLGSFVSPTKAY